jgi:hypothetical protein
MSESDTFFEPGPVGHYWSRTTELRFINRTYTEPMPGRESASFGVLKAAKVLQQKFIRLDDNHEEWRDVPLVDETA